MCNQQCDTREKEYSTSNAMYAFILCYNSGSENPLVGCQLVSGHTLRLQNFVYPS